MTELANSAPVVIFSYAPELSPGCNKAIKSLRDVGVEPTVVRLDQPWWRSNMIRSALGRMTGSASIPSVWIGGDYIGGCDDGERGLARPRANGLPRDAAPEARGGWREGRWSRCPEGYNRRRRCVPPASSAMKAWMWPARR